MPFTQVQVQTAGTTVNSASLTGTFSPAPTQNNLIICLANSDATLTMTSSGWSLADSNVNNTGLYQWYKIAGASESASVTVTPSVSVTVEMVLLEFSGNATVSVLDQTANATGASTGTTSTTTQADDLAVAAAGTSANSGSPTATWTNSFVAGASAFGQGSNNTAVMTATLALVSTAAVSSVPTQTLNPGTFSGGVVATYKAATGGAPIVSPLRVQGPSYAAHRAASI